MPLPVPNGKPANNGCGSCRSLTTSRLGLRESQAAGDNYAEHRTVLDTAMGTVGIPVSVAAVIASDKAEGWRNLRRLLDVKQPTQPEQHGWDNFSQQ